jgi:transcriptional regulator
MMYIPTSFSETDLSRLHDMLERSSFALLVTQVEAVLQITHLPLLLDRGAGPFGTLVGHLARANPHADQLAGRPSTVIFSGPHTYISPTWYEAQNVVPTWNYVAVHVTGTAELITEPVALRAIVERMTDTYEAGMPTPWKLPDSTAIDRMLDQIVGFRLPIQSIEGKWKLNQNHPPERRRKVIAQLRQQGDADSLAIAQLMERGLEDSAG